MESEPFAFNVAAFRLFGGVNLKEHSLWRDLYSWTIIALMVIQMTSGIADLIVDSWGDVEKTGENLLITVCYGFSVFKLLVMETNRNNLKKFLQGYKNMVENIRVFYKREKYEETTLTNFARTFNRFTKGYVIFVTAVGLSWIAMPVLEMRYRLPFVRSWYPFDTDKVYWYLLAYAIQAVSDIYMLWRVATLDLFLIKSIIYMCEEFSILQHSLRNINEENGQTDDEIYSRVCKCIKYHQTLIECSSTMRENMSEIMFSQFVFTTSTLCFVILAVTSRGANDNYIVNMIFYILLGNAELYQFCWISDKLAEQSKSVGQAAYDAIWTGCHRKIPSALSLVMFRSDDPIQLSAINLFPVSALSFLTLLKDSFSYYTILKQLKENKMDK